MSPVGEASDGEAGSLEKSRTLESLSVQRLQSFRRLKEQDVWRAKPPAKGSHSPPGPG
jgi:hypothetical protein